MNELLRHQKMYINPSNGQMIRMVEKLETIAWGNVWVAELSMPGCRAILMPMDPHASAEGWVEITEEEFKKMHLRNVQAANKLSVEKRTRTERMMSWISDLKLRLTKRNPKIEKPALHVVSSTSPGPEPSDAKSQDTPTTTSLRLEK